MSNEASYRVVVIDDDPDIGTEVCEMLELAKFSAVYAPSPEQASEILVRDANTGLVVVDYHMPGITGVETMQLLRSKTNKPLVFVMLTGDETQSAAINAVRAHAFDFLGKPPKREELLSAVRRAAEHLEELSKAAADQKHLESEAEALRQRVDAVSQILQQREKLLEGIFMPSAPSLDRLKRSHAGATMDFLDRLAEIEDSKTRRLTNDGTGNRGLDALECTPIEMATLLNRMIPAVKQLADQNGVAVKAVIPNRLPFLYGDERRLMGAMQDLLVSIVREIGEGDRMNIILMKQESELIVTLRIHSARLTGQVFDIFRGELPGVIDGLTGLPARQAKLLASRIVIQLHAGRTLLEQASDSEWCLRIILPVPVEDDRRSLATA